jgi:hypothetical protein
MLDAYRDLIDELLGTPSEIRAQLGKDRSPDAEPEIRAIVAAIRDRDRAVLARAQAITREQSPYLRELRLEDSVPDADLDRLLEEMEGARGDLVSLLINLSLKDWQRGAIHERAGEVTLADEIEEHVEFDERQREQFRKLATLAP